MAGATQHRQPAAAALAPAPYEPTRDDLAQMAKVGSIHDVLDQCPELPLDVRLGLLDHAWALLGGNGQAASDRGGRGACPETRRIA